MFVCPEEEDTPPAWYNKVYVDILNSSLMFVKDMMNLQRLRSVPTVLGRFKVFNTQHISLNVWMDLPVVTYMCYVHSTLYTIMVQPNGSVKSE